MQRRLTAVLAAGLVDSGCLSVAWTVILLRVQGSYGLSGTAMLTSAMFVGIALSAPVAAALSRVLGGRGLLRVTAGVESVLRVLLVVLVVQGVPPAVLAVLVTVMNITAWTGFAGMRAEIAAVSPGARALVGYGAGVAAVEAAGVAVATRLPPGGNGFDAVLITVTVCYAAALIPTLVVAGGSRVGRSARGTGGPVLTLPVLAGFGLTVLAGGPALLSVGLAALLHGPSGVLVAACAYTAGSLLAPLLVARLTVREPRHPVLIWVLLAAAAVGGWSFAPSGLAALGIAQLLAGLCLTAMEGLLDSAVVRTAPRSPTSALARASAVRAFGGAAATAVLPIAVTAVGVGLATGIASAALVLVAVLVVVGLAEDRLRRRGRHAMPATRRTVGADVPVPSVDPSPDTPHQDFPIRTPSVHPGLAAERSRRGRASASSRPTTNTTATVRKTPVNASASWASRTTVSSSTGG